jgi:flavin reductase (DIM6/NTAB) family NADH-FMN oxidoreductase RutF
MNNLNSIQKTAVQPEELRQVMRQWTTGVTVVSACWQEDRHGMTVSSFTSVSLAPPLVAISLAQEARTHKLVERSGWFGISILRDTQEEISDRFAGRTPDTENRFAELDTFSLISGAPLLKGGLAWLDCEVVSKLEAGSNTVFLGRVAAVKSGEAGAPLLYYDRDYREIC